MNSLIQVGDIKISYSIIGDGEPLVMIMGYGATRNLWESSTINELAEDFRVITFDNRGIGETERGSKSFSILQFAEDTFGLVKRLGIERTHILGWSMGSLVAQELALAHPDMIDGLVLYSSYTDERLFPPEPKIIQGLEDRTLLSEERRIRWVRALFPEEWIGKNNRRIQEIFLRSMGDISGKTLRDQNEAIYNWRGSVERLSEMPLSTLLVTGDEDVITPCENSRYMASHMIDPQLEVMKGTGHGLMFQEPDRFVSIIKEYLWGK